MNIVCCTQGDGAWLDARTGRVTASEVGDALSFLTRKGKDGRVAGDSSGTRDSYKAAMVAEIMTGKASEHYVNRHMDRGNHQEQFARAAYESRFDVMVQEVGFVIHPTNDRAGASPDGLIGTDGGLEIKVPKIETHIKYMLGDILPYDYEPQVMWNMACTGRQWWDFISYCPEMLPRHQIFRVHVLRDEKRIAEMEEGVLRFLADVDATVAALDNRYPLTDALKASLAVPDDMEGLGLGDAELNDECLQTQA